MIVDRYIGGAEEREREREESAEEEKSTQMNDWLIQRPPHAALAPAFV